MTTNFILSMGAFIALLGVIEIVFGMHTRVGFFSFWGGLTIVVGIIIIAWGAIRD